MTDYLKSEQAVNDFRSVIELLPKRFDSHDFIREFMKDYTTCYAEVLLKFKRVNTAHGQIGLKLSEFSEVIGFKSIGRNTSPDVFNEDVECEWWEKV